MRKIVAGLFISLDGVTEAPDQWHFPYWSDEMGEAVGSQMANADTMLLGRVTYDGFADYWPKQDPAQEPIAAYMNETPKLVVSNTLKSADWQNSTLISGDVYGKLREIKQQPGKDIGITGSVKLTQSLLKEGLLDELNLLVHPIVLGSGERLWDGDTGNVPLELVESKNLPNGVVQLVYRRAGS
jgi:dihydrofolate reductase